MATTPTGESVSFDASESPPGDAPTNLISVSNPAAEGCLSAIAGPGHIPAPTQLTLVIPPQSPGGADRSTGTGFVRAGPIRRDTAACEPLAREPTAQAYIPAQGINPPTAGELRHLAGTNPPATMGFGAVASTSRSLAQYQAVSFAPPSSYGYRPARDWGG